MPDAHSGYGLPIGGVLATVGAVIPYAVGSDIACRMRLSVYEIGPEALDDAHPSAALARALTEKTAFGPGAAWQGRQRADHAVLEDPAWGATRLLSSLLARGVEQLATSGSGNHFVEWGTLTLSTSGPALGLPPGRYVALLSHSGSRGVGFKIADTYTRLAEAAHPTLPREARKLSWLSLDTAEGQEYWVSMELAGRFAAANHELIHRRVARAAGLREMAAVENHHNYAFRERVVLPDGTERDVIVHRKGATPAGPGVLGIIPGSMADPGYLVRGRGNPSALSSASHGAGRAMGRRAAIETISKAARDRYLAERRVTLLEGGIDEAPQAYKRIQDVIAAQDTLVEIVGTFQPRIVRMAEESEDI
jgi:tRNA-splicing ligase RtcB